MYFLLTKLTFLQLTEPSKVSIYYQDAALSDIPVNYTLLGLNIDVLADGTLVSPVNFPVQDLVPIPITPTGGNIPINAIYYRKFRRTTVPPIALTGTYTILYKETNDPRLPKQITTTIESGVEIFLLPYYFAYNIGVVHQTGSTYESQFAQAHNDTNSKFYYSIDNGITWSQLIQIGNNLTPAPGQYSHSNIPGSYNKYNIGGGVSVPHLIKIVFNSTLYEWYGNYGTYYYINYEVFPYKEYRIKAVSACGNVIKKVIEPLEPTPTPVIPATTTAPATTTVPATTTAAPNSIFRNTSALPGSFTIEIYNNDDVILYLPFIAVAAGGTYPFNLPDCEEAKVVVFLNNSDKDFSDGSYIITAGTFSKDSITHSAVSGGEQIDWSTPRDITDGIDLSVTIILAPATTTVPATTTIPATTTVPATTTAGFDYTWIAKISVLDVVCSGIGETIFVNGNSTIFSGSTFFKNPYFAVWPSGSIFYLGYEGVHVQVQTDGSDTAEVVGEFINC